MDKKTGPTTPSLVVRRVVRAKRDRVFQAWTDPKMMRDWFYCGEGTADVTNDLRVGGKYRNEMIMKTKENGCGNAGDNDRHVHEGEYLEIIPPEKIVFTWSSKIVTNSRVTVELKDLGDSTEVRITHDRLETEELRKMHSTGWEGCLENLAHYFE